MVQYQPVVAVTGWAISIWNRSCLEIGRRRGPREIRQALGSTVPRAVRPLDSTLPGEHADPPCEQRRLGRERRDAGTGQEAAHHCRDAMYGSTGRRWLRLKSPRSSRYYAI